MSILSFDRVTYRYPDADRTALSEVSLSVEPGEFCVLAGLSASGKSTLLRAACGLVPHFHGGEFAGRAEVGGRDTRTHRPGELATVVGTVQQDPETQVVMGAVRAELAFGLENRGLGVAAVARAVEEAALALGIERLLDRAPDELSGGELQRVALGAALVGHPELVLLDEPTSQLDPVAGDELIGLLRRLNEEWGTAVVMAEHRLERCLPAADRVIALAAGRIVYDGEPGEFQRWAGRAAPALQSPAARLLSGVGLEPTVTGVKQARLALRSSGLLNETGGPGTASGGTDRGRERSGRGAAAGRILRAVARRSAPGPSPALAFRGVWHELRDGPTLLTAIDLDVRPGECVALMGRNGAGKSTLLRHAKGLVRPTRGEVRVAGPVALLVQNPGDYLVHDRVIDEASPGELERAGLDAEGDRNPRDLSGGERQRLALAVAVGPGHAPVAVCLDEPTRGMDRALKDLLAARLVAMADAGRAVLVATHDVEFAASFARRVVLLAEGRVIADGSPGEVMCGGWYFAPETARILRGEGGVLLPESGAALLRRRAADAAPEVLA